MIPIFLHNTSLMISSQIPVARVVTLTHVMKLGHSICAQHVQTWHDILASTHALFMQRPLHTLNLLKAAAQASESITGEAKSLTEANQALQRELTLSRQLERQYSSRAALQACARDIFCTPFNSRMYHHVN